MKIALVHELLTMRGGAERVLRILSQMYPDAPIYTLLYDEQKLGEWFPPERVRTSTLQRWTKFSTNHHLYLRSFPRAVEAWPFDSAQGDNCPYDLVISSSSAFAHGIITNGNPKHLCYVQSPARYLWDRTHDVLDRAGRGLLGPIRRSYLSRMFHRLRIWDSEAADRPDVLIAASSEVQRRIQLYWRRESTVIHPPIDDAWFQDDLVAVRASRDASYYLIVSQLVPYKRIELAIEACNRKNVRLVIAGEGPAKAALQHIAGPTVSFVGFKTDAELRKLYAGARATLFPGEEDFGLVPLESLACGTPVIAYRGGGATETLTENVAEFFDEATSSSLEAAIGRAEGRTWDLALCREHAKGFSRSRFEREIREMVSAMLSS